MHSKSKTTIQGALRVPGDKSITHRALIFALLSEGECSIEQLSPADDCQSTIRSIRRLGVEVVQQDRNCKVISPWLTGLKKPSEVLDAGNSGTTIRLLSGLLSGCSFISGLDGDDSLRGRPMSRVLEPLAQMGASITYLLKHNYPPFSIQGGKLQGRQFSLSVASAQVQTAVLLAGLQAEGETSVQLPSIVRDHTERMFEFINVPFKAETPSSPKLSVSKLARPVPPYIISVPADISSAAFFLVAAACLPNSSLTLTEVGLNAGRTLVLDVMRKMGADVKIVNERKLGGEPIGDIEVRAGKRLKGVTIDGTTIATGIDEIPILALAGAVCDGEFVVKDAAELRVKESDRLAAIVNNLRAAGAEVTEFPDGFTIRGKDTLSGGSPWATHGDHRMAMTGLIANLVCSEPVKIDDSDCVAVSYPNFSQDLNSLLA